MTTKEQQQPPFAFRDLMPNQTLTPVSGQIIEIQDPSEKPTLLPDNVRDATKFVQQAITSSYI